MGKVELDAEDTPRFTANELRTRWWLAALLAAIAIGGFASPLYIWDEEHIFVIFFMSPLPLVAAGWVASTVTWRVPRRCTVVVEPAMLTVGRREVARATISQGSTFDLRRRQIVVLERVTLRRDIVLHVDDSVIAGELLRALRLGPEHGTLTLRASAPLANWGHFSWGAVTVMLPFMAFLAPLPFHWYKGFLFFSTPATLVCLFLGLWSSKVVVGRQALVQRWVGMKWVYPYERIRSVSTHFHNLGDGNSLHGIEMSVEGMGDVTIVTGHNRFGGEEQAAILATRLVDTMTVFHSTQMDDALSYAKQRVAYWRSYGDKARAGDGPESIESLAAKLTDAAIPEGDRIAAVVVLAAGASEAERDDYRESLSSIDDALLAATMKSLIDAHDDERRTAALLVAYETKAAAG